MPTLAFFLRPISACALAAGWLLACGGGDPPAAPSPTPPGVDAGADASGEDPPEAGAADAADDPNYPFVVTNESVQAAGIEQEYVLVVPKEPAASPLPILFAYHGDGGSGDGLRRSWGLERTTGNNAILVYPSRAVRGGWQVENQSSNNPFLAGFDAIVARVAAEHDGDPAKVAATGFSNGAFLAHILGCWRGASLRAIGALGGGYPYNAQSTGGAWPNTYPKCEGQVPVAALVMHGENDPIGAGRVSAWYWTYVNRCSPNPDGCDFDPDNRAPTDHPECERFTDAPAEYPVEFCNIRNFGHQMWDDAAPRMWQFFQERMR